MLHGVLVPIQRSNVGREIVPSWCRNHPPAGMVTREMPAAKAAEAATPQRNPRDICALTKPRTFLTQEEMVFSTDRLMLSIVTQKKEKSLKIHLTSS